MEKRTEVKPFWVSLHCDSCPGEPEMKSTGTQLTSNPPQYLYRCSECKNTLLSVNQYPRIDWVKPKKEEEDAENKRTT